jgi:hypothetical protein
MQVYLNETELQQACVDYVKAKNMLPDSTNTLYTVTLKVSTLTKTFWATVEPMK